MGQVPMPDLKMAGALGGQDKVTTAHWAVRRPSAAGCGHESAETVRKVWCRVVAQEEVAWVGPVTSASGPLGHKALLGSC